MNARTQCVFLGGGPELSCVFRSCFVGACFVGVWSCAPPFLAPQLFGLHVFCEYSVSVHANANANANAHANANANANAKGNANSNVLLKFEQ